MAKCGSVQSSDCLQPHGISHDLQMTSPLHDELIKFEVILSVDVITTAS